MYGQDQLAERNFFFKMLGLRFKNIQIWPMENSKIVINRRLDPCLVKYGLPAGRSGVILVKNAQILKILRGQKCGVLGKFKIKHLWGLSRVLDRAEALVRGAGPKARVQKKPGIVTHSAMPRAPHQPFQVWYSILHKCIMDELVGNMSERSSCQSEQLHVVRNILGQNYLRVFFFEYTCKYI